MLIYNLLEYSDNYSISSGSFLDYYRGEVNNDANETVAYNRTNNSKTSENRAFECKTKIIERTPDNTNRLNTEVNAPLKYLSNFWKFLDLL